MLATGLLRALPPAKVRSLLLHGAGAIPDSSVYSRFKARSLLDVAVALDSKLFLSSPEAQLVLDRAWLGRAVVKPADDDDDDDDAMLTPLKRSVPATGPLARLAEARKQQPHLKRWRFGWPAVAILLLPFLAFVPPALLKESVFTPLYTPAERYWAAVVSFVTFVIIVFHLDACEENCPSGVDLDAVLGFWLLALFGIEVQAAWQVATKLISQGRSVGVAVFHLHVSNRWKRLDLTGILLAIAAGITRLYSRSASPMPEASVRAVASLLLWMRLLTVLSVHWASGPLLASLRRMLISDVSRYVVFQVLSIVSHAAAFVALYAGEQDTPAGEFLGNPLSAVMTLAEQTLPIGDPRCGPIWMVIDQSGHSGLGWAITGSFALFSVLLLLNLLIGMLGHSYDTVKNSAQMEYAHGRAREVLHAAALPVVPAPLNLLQLPGSALYFVFSLLFCRHKAESAGSLDRQDSNGHSMTGGHAAAHMLDRVERQKLFVKAWEETGTQIDGEDPWHSSVSQQLAQAEQREQRILARLEAQETLLRRLLEVRDAAPAGASAPVAAPARQTVQVSFPRTPAPSARIRSDT